MRTDRFSDKNWTFIVLIYLCLIYLPFINSRSVSAEGFLRGDSYYYRAVIVSLIEDSDLLLENNVPDPLNGQLAIGNEGLVPKHPILMSLVSLPFYLLSGDSGLLLFNLFISMFLLVLVFKLNCLLYSRPIAFVTTTLYAAGTLFLDYVYNYSPDIFSTVLLLAGLYLTLRKKFYVGAAVLAFSIFAKLPNAPLAGIILVYASWTIWREDTVNDTIKTHIVNKVVTILATVLIFLIALAPFACTNYLLFDSPFITGYQRTAVDGGEGRVVSVDHTSKFNQPLLKGIYQSLFDVRNGVIPTNPVFILACLGAFRIKQIKAQDKAYLILAICLTQFIFFANYDEWFTSHFSNRFLMTFIALSSVFASNFLNDLIRKFSVEELKKEPVL